MRVMISLYPETAHLNPLVPLAWALQGAGHEVRFVAHPAVGESVTAAGLTMVPLRGAERMPRPERVAEFIPDEAEREHFTNALALDPAERDPWDFFSRYVVAAHRIFHPPDADPQAPYPLLDDLMDFARDWRPDLVLWEPVWVGAGVVAAATGAASARFLWGPDYCGWTYEKFVEREAELPSGVENPMVSVVRPMAERYGLEIDESMLVGHWTIDPIPEEVGVSTSRPIIRMRQQPFTGAGTVQEWLRRTPERPRIAFTLGTSQRKYEKDDEAMVATMFSAFADMDVEVVATLNSDQLAGQSVPDNVHTIDYVPLHHLLATSSMLIHHGGGGTQAIATAQRVPQIVLAGDPDAIGAVDPEAESNAKLVSDRGAGLRLDPSTLTPAEVRAQVQRVVDEPSFRKGAEALYAEWGAIPSPNDVVQEMERLVEQHRNHGGHGMRDQTEGRAR